MGELLHYLLSSPPLLARYGPEIQLREPIAGRRPESVLFGPCLAAHQARLGEQPLDWQSTPIVAVLVGSRGRLAVNEDTVADLLGWLMSQGLKVTPEQVADLCGELPAGFSSWEMFLDSPAGRERLGPAAILAVLLQHQVPLAHFPAAMRTALVSWQLARTIIW